MRFLVLFILLSLDLLAMVPPPVTLEEVLLPSDHPLHEKLVHRFACKSLFNDSEELTKGGFSVNPRIHKSLMVFTHPEIEGYIFKKFKNRKAEEYQLSMYLRRLSGAKAIREKIAEHHLKHMVVPQKWLYRLPYAEDAFLVIAEKFDICSGGDHPFTENWRHYHSIPKEVLKELCILLKALDGCDAWPRNQPFTRQGQIAFIDTEHVGEKAGHFRRHILPLLTRDMRHRAKAYFYQR